MGIYEEMEANIETDVKIIRQFGPGEEEMEFKAEHSEWCIPRRIGDDIIRRSALREGADWLEGFDAQELIMRNDGSGTRDVLVKALEGMNHHLSDFRHIIEISDLFVIKELVKRGCGITFLYRKAVERELADGSILQVELADFQVSHEFTFLWRKHSVFEEEFRQVFRDLSGQ